DQAWLEDSGLSPFAARIQGNWWADCSLAPDVGMSQISALFMEREVLKRTTQYSFSTECNTWDVEAVETFNFWVNGDVGNGMRELELEFKTASAKPITIIGAAQLNSLGWCGINDWTVGVARDVTATTGQENCMPNRQKTIKSVIKLEGEALMLGRLDEVSAQSTLNKDQIFRRPPPVVATPPPADPEPVPTPVRVPEEPTPMPTPERVPEPGDGIPPEPGEPLPFPFN
ncbi:MAG: hypothetical protein V4760_11240, partial [Bdellovibrionota bacterium]